MSGKPDIIQVIDAFGMGAGGAEVRVEDDRVQLILRHPGHLGGLTFKFDAEQAKRIGDALLTGGARLSIKLV